MAASNSADHLSACWSSNENLLQQHHSYYERSKDLFDMQQPSSFLLVHTFVIDFDEVLGTIIKLTWHFS